MPTTNQTSTASMALYLRSKRAQDALMAAVKDAKPAPGADPVTGIVVVEDARPRSWPRRRFGRSRWWPLWGWRRWKRKTLRAINPNNSKGRVYAALFSF